MDSTSEQGFLSGIEPFSNSETSTPHNSNIKYTLDSLNSTEDPICHPLSKPGFSPSPVKQFSNFSSPNILTDSGSFTTSAQEITNRLKESLATSIKRESEAKISISPSINKTRRLATGSRNTSPNKSSPSKLRVRFDDDFTSSNQQDNFQSDLGTLIDTPTQATVASDSTVGSHFSPVKRNLMAQLSEKKTPKLNQSDNFLLSSLKLPENEAERQKLFEFMKKMETSCAGDPLSSLFSLENEISNDIPLSIESFQTTNSIKSFGASVPATSKHQENKSDFQLRKKKVDQKQTQQIKGMNKKTTGISRNQTKDFLRKGGPAKKNVQKNRNSKPSNPTKEHKTKESKTSNNCTEPIFTTEGHQTINSMEAVRNRLQGMLKMDGSLVGESEKVAEDYKLYFGGRESNNTDDGPESFRSTDTATLLSIQPSDFAPSITSPIESSAEDVDAMINSATSSIFTILRGNTKHFPTSTSTTRIDSSVSAENNILRDTLEKERYRRNHCEKQIQKLQNKILEIQQELAVGQSVTRKKDMMIEQLDKTLAKVVDGWKIHEQKLTKSVEQITGERNKARTELEKHKDAIAGLQSDGMRILEELSSTKERLQLKEEEQKLLQQTFQLKTHEISRVIDKKNASIEKLLNDKQTMVEDVNKLTKKMEELHDETELEKEKNNLEIIQQQKKLEDEVKLQKNKLELEKSRNNDLQKILSTTQQEVTRLEDLMRSLKQTIDNLKMQGSVEDAKYSAAVRKIEAEHQIELERRMTDKLTKFHEEAEVKERELRDSHHKQVMEITRSHQTELESQCRMYEDRIEQLEHRSRQDAEDKERKFDEILREKNENLRRQMTSKMQNLLQAHYNETLDVVGNTTGNTPMRPTRAGNISNMLEDMRSSTYMAGTKLHDISNINDSKILFEDTLRQTNGSTHGNFASINRGQPKEQSQFTEFIKMNNAYPPMTPHLTTSAFSGFKEPAFPSNQYPNSFVQTSKRDNPIIPQRTADIVNTEGTNVMSMSNMNPSNSIMSTTKPIHLIQKQQSFANTTQQYNTSNPPLSLIQTTSYEAEVNLPVNMTLTPQQIPADGETTWSSDGDRGQCLQHYIKMLLDRSPGEPLDMPHPTTAPLQPIPPPAKTTLSPIVVPGQSHVATDDNKENCNEYAIQPNHVTSEIAMGVINFLNQQLNTQPSPDLIPINKSKSPHPHVRPQARVDQRSVAFQRVKIAAKSQPQNLNQINANKMSTVTTVNSPKKVDSQLSVKDLDVSKSHKTVNQKQLSDVSQMIGSYMNGDTQDAAEKLLMYLAESQKGYNDASFNATQISMNAKGKSKTPSKSNPAWR